MTKTKGPAFGRGWYRIADLNLLASDHNAVNQQLEEVLTSPHVGVRPIIGGYQLRELTPTNQQLPVPPTRYVQYVAGAVISTLAWWLENDMPYSPHHIAQHLLLLHDTSSDHV